MLETIILPILIGIILFVVFYLNISPKKKNSDNCDDKFYCGDGTRQDGDYCIPTGPIGIIEDDCYNKFVCSTDDQTGTCEYLYINTNISELDNGIYRFTRGEGINNITNVDNKTVYTIDNTKLNYDSDSITLTNINNVLQATIGSNYLNIIPYKCNCDIDTVFYT